MPKKKEKKKLSPIEKWDQKRRRKEQKIREKYGYPKRTRFTTKFKNQVFKLWGKSCYLCGFVSSTPDDTLELDHLWPEALGGEHIPENVIPLCPRHHDALGVKRGRDPFFLLEALYYEANAFYGGPEFAEFDPAFSALYIIENLLR